MSRPSDTTHIIPGDEAQGGIDPEQAYDDQPTELDALIKIVEVQAQAINDIIVSLNNLQSRMAALEENAVSAANGNKKGKVIQLS